MKSDFFVNKLDVSNTLQLTVVSHRQLFCHFVTNSRLLRSNTQTHHLSPCMYVCVSGGASKYVKCTAPGPKTASYYHFH